MFAPGGEGLGRTGALRLHSKCHVCIDDRTTKLFLK